MGTVGVVAALGLAALVWLVGVNARAGGLTPDDPAALARTRSLGAVIAATPRDPVHILFVHGMRTEGAGSAQPFMHGLCRYGPVQCPPGSGDLARVSRTWFDIGSMPDATVMGETIWRSAQEWEASRPFVDRYVFARTGAPPVVVDEVNWWPLIFPLKCRVLVAPEAALSGADKAHLELCNRKDAPYYPWLSDAELAAALKGPTVSGGGAWANRTLKQQILNWGLSDAVIALGPMRGKFRLAMEKAFEFAAGFEGRGSEGQEFVVVSESLGSFVVMDAGTNPLGDSPHAAAVVGGSSSLYFIANQFALLELGRIANLRPAPGAAFAVAPPPADEASPMEMLRSWARRPGRTAARAVQDLAPEAPPRAKQIIAFSDPSDMLTFNVPKLLTADGQEAAIVVNVYDRNEINWFGLFVDPIKAHTGHSGNPAVLKQIFGP